MTLHAHLLTVRAEQVRPMAGRAGPTRYRALCSCGWRAKHRAADPETAIRRAHKHVPVGGVGIEQRELFA